MLAVFPVASQEATPLPPAIPPPLAEPEPFRQWLDEVRAQRQAREERRRADKEAREARRRWIDPWGAAQQEVREQENQRRRDAFLDHIERDREAFRNQGPWRFEQGPWPKAIPGAAGELTGSAANDSLSAPAPPAPRAPSYPLPGWDNRWYYRGF